MGKIALSLVLAVSAFAQYSPPSGGGSTTTIAGDVTGTIGSTTVAKINGSTPATVATSGSAADLVTGTLPAARLPNPSSSTLGGIQSVVAATHQFITSISTGGVPAQAQPACADLSNAAASCATDATNASNIGSGTLPNARLVSVPNSSLANSSVTVNGTSCSLGSTCTPTATIAPIFSQVTSVTNAGSSTNVTLVSTTSALGSPTLTAGYFGTVGTVLHVFASGTYATAATPGTLNFKIRFGTTAVCSGSGTVTASESTDMWVVNAYLTVRTTGASGTIMCNAVGLLDNALTGVPTSTPFANSGSTFDTTSALVFDFVTQWNSFASGDTITATNVVLSAI